LNEDGEFIDGVFAGFCGWFSLWGYVDVFREWFAWRGGLGERIRRGGSLLENGGREEEEVVEVEVDAS
jgi:hypothetical protein